MTAKCLIIKRIAKVCVSGSRRSVENRKALTLLAAGRASAFRLRLAGTFPVWAAGPTAGSTFSGDQIFLCSLNAAGTGFRLLGVLNPADPFVTGQGGDVFPLGQHGLIG